VAEPLGSAEELVRLILARATAAQRGIDASMLVSTNKSQ